MVFLRHVLSCLLAVGFATALSAQSDTPYFQQEVNYKINVALDDQAHTLTGNIEWEYINHAPTALTELWIHVWPNAFKNRKSAFCKQKLRQGNTRFYFADEADQGYIKNLDFAVNGQKATWAYDAQHPDIVRLTLASPLPPEGRIRVSTPFLEKIPASFSRLGHVETSYQMTQWFPKPAVYDRAGWHPIPYLDQGEFYAEFGSFDVTITLPSNYVVGATGTLQTESERFFLNQKIEETRAEMARRAADTTKTDNKKSGRTKKSDGANDPCPPSATTTKTIRYTAERVHDFAWFADKRFYVLRDTARLASGRTVDAWAMFTESDFDLWQKGAFYVKRAVESYSEWVGEYPYPQATAVHSALSAGGGMEYPMITVIGDATSGESLDNVITHEVGHNWFYGLLATNERDHTWMDEGMNSFYEQRYMRKFYGGQSIENQIPKQIYDSKKYGGVLEFGLMMLARNGLDQTADQDAYYMNNINYGLQAYMKTAHCMRWLEQSVGVQKFDAAMQQYYREWSFKHPYPADYAASMQRSGVPADWFMQLMQTTRRSDAKLCNARRNADGTWALTTRQCGHVHGPISVTALQNGQPVRTEWFAADADRHTFPSVEADAFVLDHERYTFDLRRQNNTRRTHGLLRGVEPLSVKMFAPAQQAHRTTLGVMPWVGWNTYDKAMLGVVLYNPPLPGNRLQYYLAPGYASNTKELVGGGDVRWHLHPTSGVVRRVSLGVNGRTFHDDLRRRNETPYYTRFQRVTPTLDIDFKENKYSSVKQSVSLRWHFIGHEVGRTDTIPGDPGPFPATLVLRKEMERNQIQELRYAATRLVAPNPWALRVGLEHQQWGDDNSYLRATASWDQRFFYQPKRNVRVRVFGGYFVQNSFRDRKTLGFGTEAFARGSLSLAQNGYTDYRYEQIFLARNSQSGLLSRQVSMAEGGFKYSFGSAEAASAGHSNNLLLAVNLSAHLPKRLPLGLPLKPYFDFGYATLGHLPEGGDEPSPIFWNGGFALEFFGGNFAVYFPAVSSSNLRTVYERSSGGRSFQNYLSRITWSVNLRGLDPLDAATKAAGL
jgi:hypothetical protein